MVWEVRTQRLHQPVQALAVAPRSTPAPIERDEITDKAAHNDARPHAALQHHRCAYSATNRRRSRGNRHGDQPWGGGFDGATGRRAIDSQDSATTRSFSTFSRCAVNSAPANTAVATGGPSLALPANGRRLPMRRAVVASRQVVEPDRAKARIADQIPDLASLIVVAGNVAATKALGADQGADSSLT